jgi:hypothetical protein
MLYPSNGLALACPNGVEGRYPAVDRKNGLSVELKSPLTPHKVALEEDAAPQTRVSIVRWIKQKSGSRGGAHDNPWDSPYIGNALLSRHSRNNNKYGSHVYHEYQLTLGQSDGAVAVEN